MAFFNMLPRKWSELADAVMEIELDLDKLGTDWLHNEIYWVAWNTILTAAMVIPYAAYRVRRLGGLWQAFLRPLPGDAPFDSEWPHRAYRAQMNAFEGICLFAPVAIGVYATGASTEGTLWASALYFFSRLLYAPLYYFSVPIFRTGVWFVSFGLSIYLAIHLVIQNL